MTTLRIVFVCILTVESCFGDLSEPSCNFDPICEFYRAQNSSFDNQSDEGYSGNALDDLVKALKERMTTLRDRIETQRKDFESIVAATNGTIREPRNTGSTYVQWGSGLCPDTATEIVYEGLAGGSAYGHDGGAANYLCMADWPEYDRVIPGRQNLGGIVYGSQYETTAPWTRILQNSDVPCSVCRTNRSSVLMIPGTVECPSGGWTREYPGWLSSGRWNHRSATEFVCLRRSPHYYYSTVPRTADGKLFYLVEGACGSLPCGKSPYVEGLELKCVVCSK